MSEQLPTVIQALAKVMDEVRSVGKADTNSHFGFKFRGIDTILTAVAPALRNQGVVVVPEVREQKSEVVGKNNRVVVTVAYTFYGPAGDSVTAVVPGEAMDAQDKASSKAMSVAFRTALIQALSIPTGEPDPHAGPAVSTKLARLRVEVKQAMQEKGWTWEQIDQDFTEWSKGAEIGAADEKDLTEYLKRLRPQSVRTMQRAQPSRNGSEARA